MRLRGLALLLVLLAMVSGWCVRDGLAQGNGDITVSGRVTASDGSVIAGAKVRVISGPEATSDKEGRFSLVGVRVGQEADVSADGFETTRVVIRGVALEVMLRAAGTTSQVTVTAARTSLSTDATASSVRVVDGTELQESSGYTLDDRLRQVPGLELYRRTSSTVANPTTVGISLRGLGSTAASRTLVLSDEVPMTDAFGGWIHWDEIPQLAVGDVEVLRGGASDLYGSSAIGGVINEVPVKPERLDFVADGGFGSEATPFGDALVTDAVGRWSALAASSFLRTDGYILTAPEARGTVDVPNNVHAQSGRVELREASGEQDFFVRGNVLNEARNNGTPLTNNATRLWRYSSGFDRFLPRDGRVYLRVYGSDQGYRQSFSSIAANRNSETSTRFQRVPDEEVGAAVQWGQTFFHSLTAVAGFDVRDVRATDDETAVKAGAAQPRTSISARQRALGGYGELLWTKGAWSAALSGRVDDFRTFDGFQFAPSGTTVAATPLPTINEVVLDPRLGVVRRLPRDFALSGSVFRAFRGPTMNELYRNGQVGQQLTIANDDLKSERATGFELGMDAPLARLGTLRGSYFWTAVDRPITALFVSSTATTSTYQRENLGQIRSRGVSVDFTMHPMRWVEASGGYQFALATVTQFAPQPVLVGNWIPEVARNSASLQVRAGTRRTGTLNLVGRVSGRLYDDANNQYLLHGYTRFDGYYEHAVGSRVEVYGSAQNVLDRRIEAGRTPVLTLAGPRTALIGLRIHMLR
jgi:outer membrane receptor protein involved in Fe transport